MKRAGFLFAAILALASMPAAADDFETGATYVGSPWTVDGNSEYLVDGAVDIGAVTVAQNVNGSLAIDKSGDFDLSIGALRPVNTYWWYFVDGAIDINVTGGGVKRPAPVEPAGDSFDASAAIHIDASATSTVTLGDIDESSGFRYVESVADVRAGSAMTAEPAPTDSVLIASKPRLKTNALNGMPAFDMGDFAMQSSADRNCACLKYPDVNGREGFLVVRFKSGGSNTAFFLGYIGADYYGFHRGLGDNGTGDSNCQLLTEQYAAAARQGIFCVDGWRVPEWLFRPDDEFHLISFALPSGYPVNTFGGDRNARCGGIELAEAVLFENNLSAAERQAIEARLMEKWFGSGSHSTSAAWNIGKLAFGGDAQPGFDAGATVNVGMLSGEGVFEKEGDGALCASSQSSFSGFDVKGGELSIMRAYPAEVRSAALHFDFSNEDTLTLDNGGVTHVTDVRRSGFYAYVHGQSNGNPVRTALGANGIYGIDFGDYEITSGKSKADTPGASALRIDDGSGGGYVAGVKTAFIVVSGDFENCYEHFLGSTGSWHWNRDCS
ncbi:MAG: hypothetical protein ILO34_00995, partial [Kiritimatiellae bacterium]|nr:hypothetical protein [Kiritimatiellia bacterium]